MRQTTKAPLLSDAEAKRVVLARLHGAGDAGASEEEITRALRWAEGVRADATLLRLVLDGRVSMSEGLGADNWTFRPIERDS